MEKYLDTPYVEYILRDDLLIGTYKKNKKLTLEMAKEIVKTRLEFADYKPVVAIAYNQGVVSMTKEARDYLASEEGVRGFIAGAMVLNSPVGSFIGNFILSVAKPKIPLRIFSSTAAAMKWLQKYRK